MALSPTAVIAGLASILSVFSTGIGIWTAWENHDLDKKAKALENQAKGLEIRISEQDADIRKSAEKRAQSVAEHDYTLRVVETLTKALETSDKKRQSVALALVQTVSDDGLRARLAGTFQVIDEVDKGIQDRSREVQTEAQQAVQQQQLAEGASWKYDVFWCTDQPNNQAMASQVVTTLRSAGLSRVNLRPWNTRASLQMDPKGNGLQIRAERTEQDQAKFVHDTVKEKNALDFDIFHINGNTPFYLSTFVCKL